VRLKLFKILLGVVLILIALEIPASDEDGELYCLAKNIYFEAGNQPLVGRIAVAQVTINRKNHSLFPNSICDVVYQGGEVRNKCQFSWYCDGRGDTPTDSDTWLKNFILANDILNGISLDITEEALWYHADYIDKPYWAHELTETVKINNHIFYK